MGSEVSREQLDALLSKLRSGHDLEAAASALGLSGEQLSVIRAEHVAEIKSAFLTGSGRLRSKIMDAALADDNAGVLLKLLEYRDLQFQEKESIGIIERIIIDAPAECQYCGRSTVEDINTT